MEVPRDLSEYTCTGKIFQIRCSECGSLVEFKAPVIPVDMLNDAKRTIYDIKCKYDAACKHIVEVEGDYQHIRKFLEEKGLVDEYLGLSKGDTSING